MDHITDWTARRSGGRITITGIDETGAQVRIAGVDVIHAADGVIVATDKNRESYVLRSERVRASA